MIWINIKKNVKNLYISYIIVIAYRKDHYNFSIKFYTIQKKQEQFVLIFCTIRIFIVSSTCIGFKNYIYMCGIYINRIVYIYIIIIDIYLCVVCECACKTRFKNVVRTTQILKQLGAFCTLVWHVKIHGQCARNLC